MAINRKHETDKPVKHTLLLRLPGELWEQVDRLAKREYTPATILLRRWIAEKLAQSTQGRRQ